MTKSNITISKAVRGKILSLSLPCHPLYVDRAIRAFLEPLPMFTVTDSEIVDWVSKNVALWEENLTPPSDLRAAIEAFVESGAPVGRLEIAKKYTDAHVYLCKNNSLDFAEATGLLKHLYVIADLRENANLSSVRIYHALEAIDPYLDLNWQFVMNLCERLGIGTDISSLKMQELFEREKEETETFDEYATTDVMLHGAESLVTGFGCRSNIIHNLSLLIKGEASHAPHLQVLHFLATIPEFYDHPIRYSYEFKPRGEAAKWLFAQYPKAFATGGNPFLNNVKSVEQINASWANSKKPAQRKSAIALVRIIDTLDTYPHHFKREMCEVIRKLVIKKVWSEAPETEIERAVTASEVKDKLLAIAQRQTNTKGVVEQAFVEMLAVTKCVGGREVNGLGDAVNASNVAKKKFGDCDIVDMDRREIVGLEAHAGVLSSAYLDEHLSTAGNLIEIQRQKLGPYGGIGEWKLKIVFYAHQIKLDNAPQTTMIAGVPVKLEFRTFNDILYELPDKKGLVDLYNETMVQRLNSVSTSEDVRQRYLALMPDADKQLSLTA